LVLKDDKMFDSLRDVLLEKIKVETRNHFLDVLDELIVDSGLSRNNNLNETNY
jgi:hypothetical protein